MDAHQKHGRLVTIKRWLDWQIIFSAPGKISKSAPSASISIALTADSFSTLAVVERNDLHRKSLVLFI
jgi:hypothetical protein